jgi:hypothetical protein
MGRFDGLLLWVVLRAALPRLVNKYSARKISGLRNIQYGNTPLSSFSCDSLKSLLRANAETQR